LSNMRKSEIEILSLLWILSIGKLNKTLMEA
jgi:hypothetical protein